MIAQTLRTPAGAGPWRGPGLAFVALFGVLLAVYFQTGAAMVAIWIRSETFAHAFVVPPIVLWLVWRQRDALRRLTPQPMAWVLLPMAVVALAWLLARVAFVASVEQLSFTALLVLSVPLMLGRQVTSALLFPLAFLFFAVPIGEALTPIMMQWTADFTVMAVRASGVPVYREGLQFVIPTGTWSVVEACSGIRYLMASFMVGSLFAYLNYRSTQRRLVFCAVSIVLPILANWLRAYIIVMLGHVSNNALATGADHLVYGWVFFGIVILGMFFVGARWAEPDAALPEPTAAQRAVAAQAPAGLTAPVLVLLLSAALAVLPQALLRRLDSGVAKPTPVLAFPAQLADGWQAVDKPLTAWRPVFQAASAETLQTYASAAGTVGVYAAFYRDQTETRKLVSSSNVLVTSQDTDWIALGRGQRQLPAPNAGTAMRTTELLATAVPGRADRQRLQIWQVYWVGGRFTTSDVVAKLLSAWQQVSGQGDESAVLIVHALEDAPGAATPLLEAFVRANFHKLADQLQAVRRAP